VVEASVAAERAGPRAALDLVTVAEGVESAEQAAVLAELGGHAAHGFHFARPQRPADIEPALRGGDQLAA
jgi:EAL domain-containing protein (putative c-di-GMP-specific phosphodiesterase class I)